MSDEGFEKQMGGVWVETVEGEQEGRLRKWDGFIVFCLPFNS